MISQLMIYDNCFKMIEKLTKFDLLKKKIEILQLLVTISNETIVKRDLL